jgi:tetratricopeptide (TPR) repeat protein
MFMVARQSYAQQNLTLPRVSPKAEVTQRIGLTDITINYSRPGVKGREIWGGLVPYDQVWRVGADENTTIKFTGPVKIDGKELAAGTYGFHIIPTKNEWTLIFSKTSSAWGSYSYDESEDALRVKITPQTADFNERLIFNFKNPTDNSVEIVMHWEKLKWVLPIEVDVHSVVLQSIRSELRSLPRFFWQGWHQAANYCLQNDINHEEAMQWIERSISMNENFSNLRVKAGLVEKAGNKEKADKLLAKAIQSATESELNQYGYQLLGTATHDKAIEIFKLNIERHPHSWNCYDSLGEAYDTKGDTKLAIANYTKALSMVKDETQKKRIEEILAKLKAK